ncbi:hypothetical protein EVJ58_g8886 [Rhodofomes roseus]|uniref:Uncharacterized protein n=1 Tax=Rhodofomes roseus TaxID=34475 RepID=A0A4Y9XXK1_9APHY|nr:hypothetical protein EVJ58_g8886 [Rhodofomes roseus]
MPVLLHDIGTGLESNNQLRTLVLRHTFREEWGIAWTKIGLMLQTMKSVHLRSFELVFTIFRGTGPAGGGSMDLADFNINWGPINEMISNKEFGALEKAAVTLEWHLMDTLPPGSAEHMQSMIEEGMKQLDWYKRGILTITHNKHPFTLPLEPTEHPSAQ